jgi:hypothetical protein
METASIQSTWAFCLSDCDPGHQQNANTGFDPFATTQIHQRVRLGSSKKMQATDRTPSVSAAPRAEAQLHVSAGKARGCSDFRGPKRTPRAGARRAEGRCGLWRSTAGAAACSAASTATSTGTTAATTPGPGAGRDAISQANPFVRADKVGKFSTTLALRLANRVVRALNEHRRSFVRVIHNQMEWMILSSCVWFLR